MFICVSIKLCKDILVSAIVSSSRIPFTVFVGHDRPNSFHYRQRREIFRRYKLKPLHTHSDFLYKSKILNKKNLSKFSLIETSNHIRLKYPKQQFYPLSLAIHSKAKTYSSKRSNGTFHWRAFSSSMMSAMTGSMTSSGSFNCLIHCNKITRSMKLFFKSEISREEQNELDRNK